MSKLAKVHLANIVRPRVWGPAALRETYQDDVATFETGDLIFFRPSYQMRVWPQPERHAITTPIPIDATNITSVDDWLASVCEQLTEKYASQASRLKFDLEFPIDHPVVASTFRFEVPRHWVAIKLRYMAKPTLLQSAFVVFARHDGFTRPLYAPLLREPRDPQKILQFFQETEKRIADGSATLNLRINTTLLLSVPSMNCAPGWRTTQRSIERDEFLIVMRGPHTNVDYQVLNMERLMTQQFRIHMSVDWKSPSRVSAHNSLVDLQMSLGMLELPLLVMLRITEFLPEFGPWSDAFKTNILLATKASMVGAKQRQRKPTFESVTGRRRLTDIRWYEHSSATAVSYGQLMTTPPFREPTARKRAAERSEPIFKKANTADA